MAKRNYPVGKAQEVILEALGLQATTFQEAKEIFEQMGIVVSSRREGRRSVPVVTVKDRFGGAMTAGGDGVEYRRYENIDLTPIQQWIEE